MNPILPDLSIEIPPPPLEQEISDGGIWLSLLPMLGLGVIAIFYLVRASDSGGGALSALPLMVLAGLSVFSAIFTARWRNRDRARRKEQARGAYLRTLVYKRARLQAAHDAQRGILESAYPPPSDGVQRVLSKAATVWSRRPNESGFVSVRLGVGDITAPVRILTPDPDRAHPLMPHALALAEQYRILRDVPAALPLVQTPTVALCGAWVSVSGVLRALMCNLALSHSPQDLKIHVILPSARAEEWRWLEWLPHVSPSGRAGAADLVALTPESARPLLDNLAETLNERRAVSPTARAGHLLVITDLDTVREGGTALNTLLRDSTALNTSLIVLTPSPELAPSDCRAVLTIAQNRTFWLTSSDGEISGQSDSLSAPDAEAIARALAGITQQAGGSGQLPRRVEFLDLYGVTSQTGLIDAISRNWRQNIGRDALPRPVTIGKLDADSFAELALAEGHHGPHGMLAGTTGAGKSEFLQTLICALAMEHDPRLLNFLLLDFKGGSTLNGFARLPHTVGVLTNLDGFLVERALEALRSEIIARQTLLKQRSLRDIAQYHRLYTTTPAQMTESGYQSLPHLLIIVDEFAQLAREMPEFLHELVRVAQVGRSLGVHLILGTQSPSEVVTDEMSANLQFRLCFRVQNIEASRAVLRRPDAAYLPADWPGRAYLQVGEGGLFAQFQTAYAGGDVDLTPAAQDEYVLELITEDGGTVNLLDGGLMPTQGYGEEDLGAPAEPYTAARAVVDAIIEVAQARGVPFMPPLLLPPLGERLSLRSAFSTAAEDVWNGSEWPLYQPDLSAPIGLIDEVVGHAQPALTVTLRGSNPRAGHLLITGAPNSGKTTTLLTLALSLAMRYPPDQLHLYALSLGSGGLELLSALPHAEHPITLNEPERVRLLMRRLLSRLDSRPPYSPQAVVLLIDGFEALRDPALNGLYREVERLMSDGRAAGIYLAVSASSISSIPERVRGWIPQRIALQPATPSDLTQTVGVVAMRAVAGGRMLSAGRGFIPDTPPRLCQICLPAEFPSEDMGESWRELAEEMRLSDHFQTIAGKAPAPIRPLPLQLSYDTLRQHRHHDGRFITQLGVQEDGRDDLRFSVDWIQDGAHFVVAGPPSSGKTNLLRAVGLAVAELFSPQEIALILVDFTGRRLSMLRDLPHLAAYLSDPEDLAAALPFFASETRRIIMLIDDYDLFSETLISEGSQALRTLRDHARTHPQFHLWAVGYLDRANDPLIRHLLMKRAGFAFGGRDTLLVLNQRTTDLPNEQLPAGRAYFIGSDGLRLVQTPWVAQPAALAQTIARRWTGYPAQPWSKNVPPTPSRMTAPTTAVEPSLDIDTAGLLDDLLGGGNP